MKITLKLPKDLISKTKSYAKKENKTYREVVEMALAIYLKKKRKNKSSPIEILAG